MIVTRPLRTPVTKPDGSTLATDSLPEDHDRAPHPPPRAHSRSVTLADNRTVSPTDSSTVAGLTSTAVVILGHRRRRARRGRARSGRDRGLTVADRRYQTRRIHGRDRRSPARPRDRGVGHCPASLIPDVRGQLRCRTQRLQFDRCRGHADRCRLGGRQGSRAGVTAGQGPEHDDRHRDQYGRSSLPSRCPHQFVRLGGLGAGLARGAECVIPLPRSAAVGWRGSAGSIARSG